MLIAGKFAGENMMDSSASRCVFFPTSGPSGYAEKAGFRFGEKGTHSSRTLMFTELSAVLAALPRAADRSAYASAVVEENVLEKPTASTRRLSHQRLSELYALDPRVAVFRALRRLWEVDDQARAQLSMLAALARDPLFMASAAPVLAQTVGAEIQRAPVREALLQLVGERMNESTLDKVVRNVSSSWTQSGHLKGRTFKFRQRVRARPTAIAFALWLGEVAGFRGADILSSGWVAALDCTPSAGRGLALEAKRLGLIDLQIAGDVFDFGLDRVDPGPGRV